MTGTPSPPPITPEALLRHDRPAPRYTSYPTAASFHEGVGAAEYAARLDSVAERSSEPLALYLHLPFCETKCTFCGCTMVATRDREKMRSYVDHLLREVAAVAERLKERRSVAQIHLGGGSPNHLPTDQLERLMAMLGMHFDADEGAEVSIEIDPRVGSGDQVRGLARLGFNRISFGVQDFDAEVQRLIHRRQEEEAGVECVAAAREAGFGGINIDLVYGLPGQSRRRFARTIERVVTLRPDRIAVFSFAYVPWMRPHQRAIPESSLPAPIDKLALYCDARQTLREAGYRQIGMDHFALPEDELSRALEGGTLKRSFQGYTVIPGSDTIGLGMSAIGDLGGAYVQNEADLRAYLERGAAGELATYRGYLRTPEDELRKAVIHQILCGFGLDFGAVEAQWGIDFAGRFGSELRGLERLAEEGLVELREGGFRATELGELLIRVVAMPFDAHLERVQARQGQSFSRSV